MDVEGYLETINYIVENRIEEFPFLFFKDVEHYINKNIEKAKELIAFKVEVQTVSDRKKAMAHFNIGYFERFSLEDRIALIGISLECSEVYLDTINQSSFKDFEKYSLEQPIFKNKKLFDCIRTKENGSKDNELISYSDLTHLSDMREVFSFDNYYLILNGYLEPSILEYLVRKYPKHPIFVRINPYGYFEDEPLRCLLESPIRNANPKWIANLNIYKGKKEGASYILEKNSEDLDGGWLDEYEIKGVRKLQIIAKRNNSNNLSMMIEELSIDKSKKALVGRCIHLDTDAQVGLNLNQAVLNHIDLAINLYKGPDFDSRYNEDMADGMKITNATARTHLLRIEKVPFKELINLSYMFFLSQILFEEWIRDQFQ